MADNYKQPMSLNERNRRLILTASQPRPHSKPIDSHPDPPDEEKQPTVRLEGRRRLCKASLIDDCEDDVPTFSGFSDFDSPSSVGKYSFRSCDDNLQEDDNEDDDENFKRVDSDSHSHGTICFLSLLHMQNKQTNTRVLDVPNVEKNKPLKVKLEGKKRLCKAKSRDDNHDVVSTEMEANEMEDYLSLRDFDSPAPPKPKFDRKDTSSNDIRDILGDLSAKLEILSINKTRIPKMNNQNVGRDAGSTSFTSVPSNVQTDLESKYREGETFEANVDSFHNAINKITEPLQVERKNNLMRVDGKSLPMNQSFVSKDEEEDDDCLIISDSKVLKKETKNIELQESGPSKVDVLDCPIPGDEHSITLSSSNQTFILPGKVGKILFPHQRDGLKWLWSLHCQVKGGILGDDMGLGKTMQICGFLAGLFNSSLIKRALIVAPKTLLPHWIKELSVVGLSQKTREYFGTNTKVRDYELQYILQDKGVLLTTYDILRNNAKALSGGHSFDLEESQDGSIWDYMILDEGHLIKNPSTQRAKSLLEIPAGHRIIISGTPLQNNLKELWALFHFCCPHLLGDKKWFKEKYENPILRGNDKNASDRDKRIGSAVAKELRERIQPYFLRRLKDDVFHKDDAEDAPKLSKKVELIVWLKLTSCQRQLYEAFLKSELVLSAFDGSPLAALTILKKICDHPLLLTKRAAEDVLEGIDSALNQDDSIVAEKLAMHIADMTERSFEEKHSNISCKISFIMSLLDNLMPDGHSVLIFSQTRKMLNLIQESISANGYNFLRLDGTTKPCDRIKIVNDFQEGIGARIFLLTTQVGGLGLTLTRADRVIVVDPAWNPSTDSQSVDRAYRIGQLKDVIVYRLMTCGSVEEKIYKKQIFKGGLFKTATEHKEQTRYFSQQDLREVLSLPKQGFDVSITQQQLHDEHDSQHSVDDYLQTHIKFLESQGIAGVSYHSLLFSKTAPTPPAAADDDEVTRIRGSTTYTGRSSSSTEHNVDGAEYAFNPKDVKLQKRISSSPVSAGQPTEEELLDKINRLSQILANRVMVSRLPDKGERMKKQIAEMYFELDQIQIEQEKTVEFVDLDDISEKFDKDLNV
ncbi:protein CHROMATIN REMODELING 24 [Impatiens glandulifera]|uniref:protein CHROMATIN REMODELING 24 n=1 Tax=Impatiens glandulifera TaxID=253017 RepID=UPI001FB0F0CE|nr:protein CHROMATIN REMODELING 24 [Impatiens glandulifera]